MRSKGEEPDIGNDGKVDDGLKDAGPCTDALHLIKGNGGEDTRREVGLRNIISTMFRTWLMTLMPE